MYVCIYIYIYTSHHRWYFSKQDFTKKRCRKVQLKDGHVRFAAGQDDQRTHVLVEDRELLLSDKEGFAPFDSVLGKCVVVSVKCVRVLVYWLFLCVYVSVKCVRLCEHFSVILAVCKENVFMYV